ncbi:MAG TPA: hypothetical protein PLZ36_07945 [Armatimonadota bacterium]|nr:hypothetical protein [Armatimonadota bacterium]
MTLCFRQTGFSRQSLAGNIPDRHAPAAHRAQVAAGDVRHAAGIVHRYQATAQEFCAVHLSVPGDHGHGVFVLLNRLFWDAGVEYPALGADDNRLRAQKPYGAEDL